MQLQAGANGSDAQGAGCFLWKGGIFRRIFGDGAKYRQPPGRQNAPWATRLLQRSTLVHLALMLRRTAASRRIQKS
jgi:hypothetical protein